MGSCVLLDVKSGTFGGSFSHAFALEGEPMGVVHEPIENGVGDGRDWRLPRASDRPAAGWSRWVEPRLCRSSTISRMSRPCSWVRVARPESSRISSSTRARLLRSLAHVELLILDDWGLATLTQEPGRDILEMVEDRHNRD